MTLNFIQSASTIQYIQSHPLFRHPKNGNQFHYEIPINKHIIEHFNPFSFTHRLSICVFIC